MKTIVLIIVVSVLGFFAYQILGVNHSNPRMVQDGSEVVIESGDNTYVAEIVSDYSEELRIYGINDNDTKGWTPIGYANYIFVASPLSPNSEGCERNDAVNAPFLNIIAADEDVIDAINDLKDSDGRRSATIIGERVRIKEFYHKDEDNSDSLTKQGKLDPRNAIIVSEIYIEDE